MAAPSRVAQSSFGIDVRFTGTRISNRYSLNRSLNDTHDHRLTLDNPPNSGVARLACFIDSRAFIIPSRGEHVHALRSRERGCFLVVQTLWAEKNQSTTDAGSLNTFDRNEIEVAPISSALLRIARLVILYKTCRVPDQELAADGVSGPV